MSKLAKSFNEVSLAVGRKQFLSTVFDGKNGFYYDAVGDEIFHVTRISTNHIGPVYKIDFGDEVLVGNLKDHGFNIPLES